MRSCEGGKKGLNDFKFGTFIGRFQSKGAASIAVKGLTLIHQSMEKVWDVRRRSEFLYFYIFYKRFILSQPIYRTDNSTSCPPPKCTPEFQLRNTTTTLAFFPSPRLVHWPDRRYINDCCPYWPPRVTLITRGFVGVRACCFDN